MKATATANANIALVKYWGKRNEKLVLPANSSISMTTDNMQTTTTVEFGKKYSADSFFLNGKKVLGIEAKRVFSHLGLIRKITKRREKARVSSKNNFLTSAGLASASSGFAALTLAATNALNVTFDKKHLSIIARQGSGSACRSIFGGFVEWRRGHKTDGSDSFAVQIAEPSFWNDFCMIATIVSRQEKKIKSRAGMRQTVLTSPMYKNWLETIERDIWSVKKGILDRNFSSVGKTAQANALKMHATMLATIPPIIYWQPATMEVMHLVLQLCESGVECYFTIDAGPQVKVLCLKKNSKKIQRQLDSLGGIEKTIVCSPGEDAKLLDRHLF